MPFCSTSSITCVYLASKTEEDRKEVDFIIDISHPPSPTLPANSPQLRDAKKKLREEILSLEYVLLDGLKFHLHLFQPHQALTGVMIDIQVGQSTFFHKKRSLVGGHYFFGLVAHC